MLATFPNPPFPVPSISLDSSTYPNPRIRFSLSSESGFCRAAKRVTDDRYLGFHSGTRLVRASRFGLEFRNCVRLLVKVRCGLSEVEDDDAYYMRRAVERAREAIGCTSPNPMVGCVIVKDGQIVGEGFHPKAGQSHAEVFALRNAGELAEGATAYVSLEPCNHYGRTPPCSEALIKAKVSKVVVGMVDPNPIVASKGVSKLRDAGIEVTVGVEEDLCKRLNESYIHKMLTGKPFVTLRYSISTNGLLCDQLGEGASDHGGYYSKLLQEYDAVIQSSADVAEFGFPTSNEPDANQPRHVIISTKSDYPISIPNHDNELAHHLIVFTAEEADFTPDTAQMGVEKVTIDKMSLEPVLDYCGKQGLCSALLDVRGNLSELEEPLKDAIERNLVQKVVVEVLPFWAGGGERVTAPLSRMTQRLGLKNLSTATSGRSILLEGYF